MCESKARLVVFQSKSLEGELLEPLVLVKVGRATKGMTNDLREGQWVLFDQTARSFFGEPIAAVVLKTMLDPGYLDLPEHARKEIESTAAIFHVQVPVRP